MLEILWFLFNVLVGVGIVLGILFILFLPFIVSWVGQKENEWHRRHS